MKVRCITNKLTAEQKLILGIPEAQDPRYQITEDKIYTVLGISYKMQSQYCNGIMLEIEEDQKSYCVSIPLCLFEVVDPRLSKYWVSKQKEYDLTMWPEEFYSKYFHDDLSEGVEGVKVIYNTIVEKIVSEFDT